jgi:hypothetical protein
MPLSPTPSNDYFASLLRGLQQQITALSTQQNQYVIDNTGTTRVQVGWHQADNSYGVTIFDPSGNKRVVLGQLPNGDHGIELIDASGHAQELLPALDQYVGATLNTTSGTPVTLSGSPTVTVNIGANGDCEITAGAFVGYPTAGSANALPRHRQQPRGQHLRHEWVIGWSRQPSEHQTDLVVAANPLSAVARTPHVQHAVRGDWRHRQLLGQLPQGAAALK